MYQGYFETDERINDRWELMQRRAAQIETQKAEQSASTTDDERIVALEG